MAAITDFASANRLGPQSRGLIFLLGALTGLTALSIDMSLPALPTLAASLHTSVDQAALTLSMFLAGYSVSQLFYGPLSDRYGRRPLLLAGLVLFTAGGIGCALAPNIGQLIEWRLVQGLGACAGPILARALVRDLYQSERGIQILSYMTLVMSVAPLLAPILGGYLLTLHWRASRHKTPREPTHNNAANYRGGSGLKGVSAPSGSMLRCGTPGASASALSRSPLCSHMQRARHRGGAGMARYRMDIFRVGKRLARPQACAVAPTRYLCARRWNGKT
jgi:multidrug resistance protein